MKEMLLDGHEIELEDQGHRWVISWHPPYAPPDGIAHGSAGICVTDTREVVLISSDGKRWDFPAGRPEGCETWEETLRREMLEEACAIVTEARMLGFSRGRCIVGPEEGRILVRSIWHAKVSLLEWNPHFEVSLRRLVPIDQAITCAPTVFRPVWQRAFHEAGWS